MNISVQYRGGVQLSNLLFRLRSVDDKTIARDLSTGLRQVAKPLERAVKADMSVYMPDQGGYAGTMSRAFRTTVRVARGAGAGVRIEGYARGQKALRAVDRLNAGELRHPVYGRTRRTRRGVRKNPWVRQRVQPGFWTDKADAMGPQATQAAVEVLDRIGARIAGG